MSLHHLENVVAHLGAALRQQAPSDDKIIMDHVRDAYEAAQKALIVYEGRDQTYEELTGFYNDLVSEKERYRTALEKIRYTEGVGRAVEKLALDALRTPVTIQ